MNRIRFGVSLVELMVVMSVSSTLMIVSAGWIHQSLRLGSAIDNRNEHHQSLLRLARQLRDDVQRGVSMEMADDSELLITLDDGSILRYTIRETEVAFRATNADDVVNQDAFKLARRSVCRWDATELPDAITFVTIRASSANADVAVPVTDLRIRTSVDRWSRLGIREAKR